MNESPLEGCSLIKLSEGRYIAVDPERFPREPLYKWDKQIGRIVPCLDSGSMFERKANTNEKK
jgi:hypothetical protein